MTHTATHYCVQQKASSPTRLRVKSGHYQRCLGNNGNCTKTSKTVSQLNEHYDGVHSGVLYACLYCNHTTSWIKNICKHIRTDHVGRCPECDQEQHQKKKKMVDRKRKKTARQSPDKEMEREKDKLIANLQARIAELELQSKMEWQNKIGVTSTLCGRCVTYSTKGGTFWGEITKKEGDLWVVKYTTGEEELNSINMGNMTMTSYVGKCATMKDVPFEFLENPNQKEKHKRRRTSLENPRTLLQRRNNRMTPKNENVLSTDRMAYRLQDSPSSSLFSTSPDASTSSFYASKLENSPESPSTKLNIHEFSTAQNQNISGDTDNYSKHKTTGSYSSGMNTDPRYSPPTEYLYNENISGTVAADHHERFGYTSNYVEDANYIALKFVNGVLCD